MQYQNIKNLKLGGRLFCTVVPGSTVKNISTSKINKNWKGSLKFKTCGEVLYG